MITLEQAIEIALLVRDDVDSYTEFENMYVFENRNNPGGFGGRQPVCIDKETGEWTFPLALAESGFDEGAYVGEGMIPDKKRKKSFSLRDAVYGAAVGDALGVPYEFLTRDTFECTGMTSGGHHGQPAGTFSDDTSMMLATCDSIRARDEKVRTGDMYSRFRDWAYKGHYAVDGNVFDIGNTVATAISDGKAQDGEYSNGNGSLMRIAPLAFIWADDDEVRAASAVTHAHRISTESCLIFVHLLRKIIFGVPFDEALESVIPDDDEFAFLHDVTSWPREKVKSGGFVLDTLGAALWCFANTDSYAECVLAAVNLGNDSDTTACVAGALAGTYYGYDAIPTEWLETLRGKDIIDACLFRGIERLREHDHDHEHGHSHD
ncbi:MAG: ADP-ribosylglycohydrolase family protein [Coriobacteriales bacterium]|jgi:ADP-ribosylglycohydrolase